MSVSPNNRMDSAITGSKAHESVPICREERRNSTNALTNPLEKPMMAQAHRLRWAMGSPKNCKNSFMA